MTQQRYVIRLADGTLDMTEGVTDVYDSYSDAVAQMEAYTSDPMIADTYAGAVIEIYSEED